MEDFETDKMKMEFDVDTEAKEVKARAPWGDATLKMGDSVGLVKFAHTQLKMYERQGNTTQSLKDDIAGYEEILASKDPATNAGNFFGLKHADMLAGVDRKSNLQYISALKESGKWL